MITNNPTACPTGIVYQKTSTLYSVLYNGRFISCSLTGNLRKIPGAGKFQQGKYVDTNHDPIAVGDQVLFTENEGLTGQITAVLPRRNRVSRRGAIPMPGAHPFEQVIAANVDRIIPVFAATRPAPHWGLLDRYLVLAEAAGIPALICITKTDLLDNPAGLEADLEAYRQIGYPIIHTSSAQGEGIEELKQALQGRISVLMGKSGVGKSSLLNSLQPGLGLRINEVGRESGKGKHTTTGMQMFALDFGGAVVDTPGIRELGIWDVDGRDLALFFPEMRPYLGLCKFRADCRHEEEPGCAVRKAVMNNQISPRRYQSYLKIKEDEIFQ
jgi:ribosome biogenesis GTPase / thiamine phosphate phosphatase